MMICALGATGFRLPAWLIRERNTHTSTEQNAPPLTGSEELKESRRRMRVPDEILGERETRLTSQSFLRIPGATTGELRASDPLERR
jgi:hypothetical protein